MSTQTPPEGIEYVPIELTINGETERGEVDPRAPLVFALREEFDYTGTKFGCLNGACGACTVRLDGDLVKSCAVLAASADGSEVETIEGVAEDGELDAVQRAFWDELGFQCGYCTPGMIMTVEDLLAEDPDPDGTAIRESIDGNLCRCTGYNNIVESVRAAAGGGEGAEGAADD
jgi:carbon-monoxide dehydrogenase small subunit